MRNLYLSVFFCLLLSTLWAQPSNDECINAIQLDDISSWCSATGELSNEGATESAQDSPFCFPTNQTNNDVWFSFTAVAVTVNLTVSGSTAPIAGGTLESPQLALYSGDCGILTEIECLSDAFSQNTVTTFGGPLDIGETYYIRVSARDGQTGTFQLCVNNFNEVPDPSGDCPTGVILCDKSPFTVQSVSGAGNDPNEISDTGCNSFTCNIEESSSSWYKWTCDDPGSLTFDITPVNPADDIDFLLFELPNGIDDCSDKQELRCMVSGENVGGDFSEWQPCTGTTGMSENDGDDSEACGCQTGDNNYVSAIQMEAGKSYALVIFNFSNTGSGFSIEFGGSGTFLGPEAAFTTEPETTLCVGESITFTDASTFVGDLISWEWNFGPGATPAIAVGAGPHQVSYNTPGAKSVVLTVESESGCIVTDIATVTVECCDDHFDIDGNISSLECPNSETGAIDLSVSSDFGPFGFQWSNGESTEDIASLGPGMYTVTVVDESTCEAEATFTVGSPPDFAFDTLVVMPTCNGGTDGSVTLQVSGGTPPYEYNWQGSGFSSDNSLTNISQGDYSVIVRDANGCEVSLVLPVRELELQLDPAIEAITPPSCTGDSNGSIIVTINNGLPPYQYNFNDGNGYVDENVLNNLPAGTYFVDVLDANLCSGTFVFEIQDPPPLTLDFEVENISCFGEEDGSLTAIVGGGVGNYTFDWSNNATTGLIEPLSPGDYTLTVTDGNGCEIIGTATVIEPAPVFIDVVDVIDLICFEEQTGSITVAGSGGTPPFEYSLDGVFFQTSSVFDKLLAGDYTITVMDAMGCTETVDATIIQPPELIVDAGDDLFIDLGFSADLRAFASEAPVDWSWTPIDNLSCIDCPNPVATPVNTTTYLVTVVNEEGCEATDDIIVHVVKNRPIYIPNAFSPNGDGINDGFTIYGGPAALEINDIKIFNRWGGLVFERSGIPLGQEAEGWDGTFLGRKVDPGVFTFFVEVAFIDGEVELYKGDITVVR